MRRRPLPDLRILNSRLPLNSIGFRRARLRARCFLRLTLIVFFLFMCRVLRLFLTFLVFLTFLKVDFLALLRETFFFFFGFERVERHFSPEVRDENEPEPTRLRRGLGLIIKSSAGFLRRLRNLIYSSIKTMSWNVVGIKGILSHLYSWFQVSL